MKLSVLRSVGLCRFAFVANYNCMLFIELTYNVNEQLRHILFTLKHY
jgi:hypothetical protein